MLKCHKNLSKIVQYKFTLNDKAVIQLKAFHPQSSLKCADELLTGSSSVLYFRTVKIYVERKCNNLNAKGHRKVICDNTYEIDVHSAPAG